MWMLPDAPEQLSSDRAVVMEAVSMDGLALQHAG